MEHNNTWTNIPLICNVCNFQSSSSNIHEWNNHICSTKHKFLTMMYISSQALVYPSTFVSVMKKRNQV